MLLYQTLNLVRKKMLIVFSIRFTIGAKKGASTGLETAQPAVSMLAHGSDGGYLYNPDPAFSLHAIVLKKLQRRYFDTSFFESILMPKVKLTQHFLPFCILFRDELIMACGA